MSTAFTARQSEILRLVRERGTSAIADLAAELRVSTESIRRDLKPLTAAREIVKRHGSVSMPYELGEAPFERRLRENAEAKRTIARHAARLDVCNIERLAAHRLDGIDPQRRDAADHGAAQSSLNFSNWRCSAKMRRTVPVTER